MPLVGYVDCSTGVGRPVLTLDCKRRGELGSSVHTLLSAADMSPDMAVASGSCLHVPTLTQSTLNHELNKTNPFPPISCFVQRVLCQQREKGRRQRTNGIANQSVGEGHLGHGYTPEEHGPLIRLKVLSVSFT